MAKSDGFNKITKHQKTRILPLRWIGNLCGEVASNSLVKAFDLEEDGDFGYRFKIHCKVFKYLDKPYRWWGTYYILDTKDWLNNIKESVAGKNWDDYDEDGIAYWEKLTDSEFTDT